MSVRAAPVSSDRPRVRGFLAALTPRGVHALFARWLRGRERAPFAASHTGAWPEPLDWGRGVSIVIVDETGNPALGACLDAAEAAIAAFDEPGEIIVVAGGVPDDAHARLEQAHPGVNWRFHRRPRGLVRALLDGVASARHGAVYVLDAGSLPAVDAFVQAARWRAAGTAVIASATDSTPASASVTGLVPAAAEPALGLTDAVTVPASAALVHAARLRGWLAGSLARDSASDGFIDLAGFGRCAGYDVVACPASRVRAAAAVETEVGRDVRGAVRPRFRMRRLPARDGVLWVTPRRVDPDADPASLRTLRLVRALARDRDVVLLAPGAADTCAADAPWAAAYGIEPSALPAPTGAVSGGSTRGDGDAALRRELQRLVAIHRPAVVLVEHLEAATVVDWEFPCRPRFVMSLPELPLVPAHRRGARRVLRDLAAVARHDGVLVATAEDRDLLGDPRACVVGHASDPAPLRALVDALVAETLAVRQQVTGAAASCSAAPLRASVRDDAAAPLLGRRLQVT